MISEKNENVIPAVIFAVIVGVILFSVDIAVPLGNKLAALGFFIGTVIVAHFALQYNADNAPVWNRGGVGKGYIYFGLLFATIIAAIYCLRLF